MTCHPEAATLDVAIAGGGLAACLTALRLRAAAPGLRMAVIERGNTLGGNHTWSFHGTDVTAAQHAWLAPVVAHAWAAQTVHFPGYSRTLDTSYHSVSAGRLHAHTMEQLGDSVHLDTPIACIEDAHTVRLDDGRAVRAHCVIDARGATGAKRLALGYQTFLGREVTLARPHGIDAPVIMDARVEQLDGYRFVYLLPLDRHRLLMEDTYYNDHPRLDAQALGARLDAYAVARGWRVTATAREERGVLPIVMAGELGDIGGDSQGAVPIGMRAGLFQAVTGYSLPFAARLADLLAAALGNDATAPHLLADTLHGIAAREAERHWREQAYCRLLSRMLFMAAAPHGRRRIFERFYTLDKDLIERFYAGRLRKRDKLRILMGKPPVPVAAAMRCLRPGAAHAHHASRAAVTSEPRQ